MRDRETVEAIACELEQIIDENSLSGILKLIARICDEKSDHVHTNWGDRKLGVQWHVAARKIERIVHDIDV